MSGGAWEYMAAYRNNTYATSGFAAASIATYNTKYFDAYNENSAKNIYNYRILGYATGEIGPFYYYADKDSNNRYHNNWYADVSFFVDSSHPWLLRGSYYGHGVLAGQFAFGHDTGNDNSAFDFRLVLIK